MCRCRPTISRSIPASRATRQRDARAPPPEKPSRGRPLRRRVRRAPPPLPRYRPREGAPAVLGCIDRDDRDAVLGGERHHALVVGAARLAEFGHDTQHGHLAAGRHGSKRLDRFRNRQRIGVVGVVDDPAPDGAVFIAIRIGDRSGSSRPAARCSSETPNGSAAEAAASAPGMRWSPCTPNRTLTSPQGDTNRNDGIRSSAMVIDSRAPRRRRRR